MPMNDDEFELFVQDATDELDRKQLKLCGNLLADERGAAFCQPREDGHG